MAIFPFGIPFPAAFPAVSLSGTRSDGHSTAIACSGSRNYCIKIRYSIEKTTERSSIFRLGKSPSETNTTLKSQKITGELTAKCPEACRMSIHQSVAGQSPRTSLLRTRASGLEHLQSSTEPNWFPLSSPRPARPPQDAGLTPGGIHARNGA